MKCHNFYCDRHGNRKKNNIMDGTNCVSYSRLNVKTCEARKRYNRSIAPLLAIWNSYRSYFVKLTASLNSEFINSVSSIEDDKKIPEYFDSQMLDIVKKIGRKRNKYFSDITINNSESSAVISPKLERNVIDLIGDDRKMYGSVTGMLEQLNIHNRANKFFIYPSIGPTKVECNFPASLLKEAIDAMAHRIKVKGKLKYKEKDRFPYKVFVDEIEIYPAEKDLPTLSDLRGSVPDITGDMTTIEFINHIRENDE